jgi:hypothetical protein
MLFCRMLDLVNSVFGSVHFTYSFVRVIDLTFRSVHHHFNQNDRGISTNDMI